MIQFNLLPDVKMEYIRSQRLKQTVVSVSVVVAGAALTIMIILFLVVNVFQKAHLSDLNKDIDANTNKIQNIPDLNKILTVQNQLNSLTALHDKKPVTSRLFTYIKQVLPVKLGVSSLTVDFTQHTMQFQGDSNNIATVNQFVDTLKYSTYKNSTGADTKAFSNVVLNSFARTDKGATYSVNLNFDPAIFDTTQNINKLTVPNIITTHAQSNTKSDTFTNKKSTNTGSQ